MRPSANLTKLAILTFGFAAAALLATAGCSQENPPAANPPAAQPTTPVVNSEPQDPLVSDADPAVDADQPQNEPAAPTTDEPSPTAQEPEPEPEGFAIGASYSGTCGYAAMGPPVTTDTEIQVTMSCTGVPSQYMAVLVVYGDPSLTISSMGDEKWQVTGSVIDILDQHGMELPVILASQMTPN
ncbi:MAG: hypothetical protein FWG16_01195 [Micrococcales bacterium]|nr:hypothetical protein [Micrococcales bacterium]